MSRALRAARSLPAALRSALRPVLVGIVAGALAGAAWGLADQPTYLATAGVVVTDGGVEEPATVAGLLELARGQEVAQLAAAGLGDDLAGADLLAQTEFVAVEDGGVILVRSTAEIPDLAAGAADAFAAALVEVADDALGPSLLRGAAAELPSEPSSDRSVAVSALIGGLLAAALGVFLVGAREARRLPVRRAAELEAAAGAPVLAQLGPGATPLELLGAKRVRPTQLGSDRMGALLAALRRRQLRGRAEFDTLAIISPAPAEGRTAVALGLAVAWAAAGAAVVVVETDLRRPRFGRTLGLGEGPGLRGYLAGTVGAELVIDTVSIAESGQGGESSFDAIAAGRARDEPGLLLAGSAFPALIERLGESYDVVILDTPPMLTAADAELIAGTFSASVIVARYGVSRLPEIAELASRLPKRRLTGVVLTRAPHHGPGRRRLSPE